MREAVIVAGARTPVGKAKKGTLANVRPDDLGALVVRETLKRAGNYEGNIDDLIIWHEILVHLLVCPMRSRRLPSTVIVLLDFRQLQMHPSASCLAMQTRSLPAVRNQ